MKKSLGRFILIFLLLTSYAGAKELVQYKLTANKTSAYTKEALVITFTTIQKDHTDNMMFSLQAKQSNDYKIILLNKEVDDKKRHNSSAKFTYLLFGLNAKDISVDFNFIVRTASDKAVAHSVVDDHDDSIATQTHDTAIKVKPLKLNIMKLKHDVDLVGDFTLNTNITQKNINQYESVNIIYTLQGEGYEEQSFKPISTIKDVTIFSEINDLYNKNTKKGYAIKREYIYALSAKNSFIIPALKLEAYSPTKKTFYTLTSPEQDIKVEAIETSKLLDNDEYPKETPFINTEVFKKYFIYIIIFFSGYLTAKIKSPTFRKKEYSKEYKTIKEAETPTGLIFTLINLNKGNIFTHEVQLLEEILYKNVEHNFHTIKKNLLKKVK